MFGRFLYHKAFSSAQPGLSKAVRWAAAHEEHFVFHVFCKGLKKGHYFSKAAPEPHFFFSLFLARVSKSSYYVLGWNHELPKQENIIEMSCLLLCHDIFVLQSISACFGSPLADCNKQMWRSNTLHRVTFIQSAPRCPPVKPSYTSPKVKPSSLGCPIFTLFLNWA